jgi:hypothetical protein
MSGCMAWAQQSGAGRLRHLCRIAVHRLSVGPGCERPAGAALSGGSQDEFLPVNREARYLFHLERKLRSERIAYFGKSIA